MEKYINSNNQEYYEEVELSSPFCSTLFHKPATQFGDSENFAFHSNLGSLTVVDRMTGYGWRDVESGYRDMEGNFWLASGNYDVRYSGCETVGDAIEWVKQYANTCVPK